MSFGGPNNLNFTFKGSKYPLLLHCGHSICSSCLQQNLKAAKGITCRVCGLVSSLESSESVNECFPFSIYILGSLVASQNFRLEKDKRLSYLAKNNVDFNYTILGESNVPSEPVSSGSVCEECSATASWHCENCKSNFCELCWSKVHGSAKSLTKHFKIAIGEVCRSGFKKCIEHENQDLEFFCKGCSTVVCSHCVILKHQGEGHHSVTLKEKNLEMLDKVKIAVEDADRINKRMKQTLKQIKLKQSSSECSDNRPFVDMKNQITKKFSQIHGILQLEEERLLKRLHEKSNERENCYRNLETQLEKQTETVESLLRECDFALKKPQTNDLTDLYKKLKEVENFPCYLISRKSENEEAKVVFDEKLMELLRVYCTMVLPSDELLELRSSTDLPEDYAVDPLNVSDLDQSLKEGQDSSVSSVPDLDTLSNCSSRELQKDDFNAAKEPKVFLERKSYCVRVSFIKNPGEFYVTLNSQRAKQKQIDKRASLVARSSTDAPETYGKDEIFLVKYNVDQKWYRGRVMEVFSSKRLGGEECVLIYYLDYGNFETVPISRLRLIPPDLLEEPPLAIKCKLFDCVPKNGEWCEESTMTMEKILKNHTATMFVMKVRTDCLEVDLSVVYPEGQIGRDIVSVRDALLFLEFSSFVHGFKVPRNATAFKYLDQCLPTTDDAFDVTVTHVNSPSDFYVQRTKQDAPYIYKLAVDIQNYYEENSEKGMIYNPILDMPCAALFSADQRWYRAKIVDVPGKKMVTVFYVDYGNKETIQWTGIRKLKESFARWPPMALNCALAGILPANGEPWTFQAKSYLKKNILMKDGRVCVQGNSKSKQKIRVLLFKKENNKEVCLNTLLVDLGFAIKSNTSECLWILKTQEGVEEDSDSKISKKSLKYEKERSVTNSDREVDIGRKNGVFKERRKSKPSAKELRELHESEKKNHVGKPFPRQYADDKVDDYNNIFKVKVDVISAESPSSIYVTFLTLVEELESLQAKLNDFYQDSTDVVKEWTAGNLCAVFDSSKRSWYRASVTDILPNDRVRVFLKDVARVCTEPVSSLRPLDPSFKNYSTCAVKCHLADVRPPGAQWPGISSEFLLEQLDNHKEVYMTKRGQTENGSLPVELWIQKVVSKGALEPISKEWVTLNRLLVNQGLAIPIKAELWHGWEMSTEDEEYSEEEKSTDKNTSRETLMEVSGMSEAFVPSLSSAWIPPLPLRRSRFIGMPTYVDYNAFIYMYDTEQDEENLKMIREALFRKYANSKPSTDDHYWLPDQLCIARYHVDNSWYRGLVLQENGDMTYDVLFIDYGNIETCQSSDLRKRIIMEDIPILIHKFQLHGIETTSKDGEWPVMAIDMLHSLIVDKKCEVNILKHPLDPSEAHMITLKVIESDIDVGKFLVGKNLAFFDDSGSDIAISDNDFLVASELGDELNGLRYVPLIIPDNCNEFLIEVTALISEREFYANIVLDESLPPSLKKILNEFKDLQQELAEECHLQPPVKKLIEGIPCCCLDFVNNVWCRGEIESFIENKNSVFIYYVDCGKKDFIHKDFLRECKDSWVDLPKMAVKFRLGDVEKNANISESVFRKALTSCLNVKPLVAEILSKRESFLEVKLTKTNGSLAYQEMIDKGLMKFI